MSTPDDGRQIDDPAVAAEAEEYQITDPPEVDEERPIDEPVADPEAPLVDEPGEGDVADEARGTDDPRLE